MIKKIAVAAMLLFTTPVMAATNMLCVDVTVRFTMLSMLAKMASSEDEYRSNVYKSLLRGNADQNSREVLMSLVDMAWDTKSKDTREAALVLYNVCVKDTGVET